MKTTYLTGILSSGNIVELSTTAKKDIKLESIVELPAYPYWTGKVEEVTSRLEYDESKCYSEIEKIREKIKRDPNEIDRNLLITMWRFARLHNLYKLESEIIELVKEYLDKIKRETLKIEVSLEDVPKQFERLKKEEGLTDEEIALLREILILYVDGELRKKGKNVSEPVKEYLANLHVYFYLEEKKVKNELEELIKVTETRGSWTLTFSCIPGVEHLQWKYYG